MPLPLIPIILGGASLASAAFGAKKGYDAVCDSKEAKRLNARAQEIVDDSQKELNSQREYTNNEIENFAKFKIDIFNDEITEYVDIFEKIKNIEFDDAISKDDDIVVDSKEFEALKTDVLNIKSVIGGGVSSLGAGALAGFGAYGSVGLLATASTGTAISLLSGVAATNATLAWLGGGSLASGGLGMAGGTMVLGGLVAGPALMVAGWAWHQVPRKLKTMLMQTEKKPMLSKRVIMVLS